MSVKKATVNIARKVSIPPGVAYEKLNDMKLTNRERDIIAAILDGDTDHKSIAKRLEIAPSTAQEHTGALRRKLGLQNKSDLVKWINRMLRNQ